MAALEERLHPGESGVERERLGERERASLARHVSAGPASQRLFPPFPSPSCPLASPPLAPPSGTPALAQHGGSTASSAQFPLLPVLLPLLWHLLPVHLPSPSMAAAQPKMAALEESHWGRKAGIVSYWRLLWFSAGDWLPHCLILENPYQVKKHFPER
ncbi:uncharacterized protein LOC114589983 [Podarcis muralis]